MKQSASSFVLGVAGAVTGTLLMQAAAVRADGVAATDSVARVVQYSGTVEFNGAPLNDPALNMRFTLWDGASAVLRECWVSSLVDGCTVPTSAVNVTAGRFSVGLGTHTDPAAFERVVAAADALELGIEVYDIDAGWISLQGRQRLTPAPFALWTSTATNLQVSGTDSNGTVGPLNVYSGAEVLAVDGNEIDSNGTLGINTTSRSQITIGGYTTFEDGVDVASTLNADQLFARSGVAGDFMYASDAAETSQFFGGAWFHSSIWSRSTTATARFDGPMDLNGALDIDANVAIAGAESVGPNSALLVESGVDDLRVDGDEIDSTNRLRLNTNTRIPIVIPSHANAIEELNTDLVPEMYQLVPTTGTNPLPFDCTAAERGSMIVAFLADQGQDGLCVCMEGTSAFAWFCLNP